MTRINLIHPATLTDKHLLAEYRELPRIFQLAYNAYSRNLQMKAGKSGISLYNCAKRWEHKQPKEYTLGTGHVTFFYDKLTFLANRQKQIVAECLHRGFQIQFTDCLFEQWRDKIPAYMWKDYKPTSEAIAINLERINKRLSGDKT